MSSVDMQRRCLLFHTHQLRIPPLSLAQTLPCDTNVMNSLHYPYHYRDPRAREERKEKLAPLGLLDLLVPKAPLEMTVQRVTL